MFGGQPRSPAVEPVAGLHAPSNAESDPRRPTSVRRPPYTPANARSHTQLATA